VTAPSAKRQDPIGQGAGLLHRGYPAFLTALTAVRREGVGMPL